MAQFQDARPFSRDSEYPECEALIEILPQAELKRIAGQSRDGIPTGSSNVQEMLVGEAEASVELAGGGEHAQTVRNGLRRLSQTDYGLSTADVLAPAEIVLRDANVVEQDSRSVDVAVKPINIAIRRQAASEQRSCQMGRPFKPHRARAGLVGKWVGGSDEASALRAFIFGERRPHALGGKTNSTDANVASQIVVVERGNNVAVVGLGCVGDGEIGLAPIDGHSVIGV